MVTLSICTVMYFPQSNVYMQNDIYYYTCHAYSLYLEAVYCFMLVALPVRPYTSYQVWVYGVTYVVGSQKVLRSVTTK